MTQNPETAPLNSVEGTDLDALDRGTYTQLRTARNEARLELDRRSRLPQPACAGRCLHPLDSDPPRGLCCELLVWDLPQRHVLPAGSECRGLLKPATLSPVGD